MGVLLALLGAFAFALMNVFVRNGVRQSDGNTGVLTTMLVNVAIYAVLLAAVIATRGDVRLEAGAVAWFVLAGISATLFGRQTLFGAIRLIGAARGAAIKNATPLVAVGIAILVLGERLTPLAALGIALIIGGLVLLIAEALRTGSPDTRADPVGVALESEAVAGARWRTARCPRSASRSGGTSCSGWHSVSSRRCRSGPAMPSASSAWRSCPTRSSAQRSVRSPP
jgi:uncharacterized membrane protein